MKKGSFNYDELINCANGELFGPGNAKLPSPPMLMFDRIIEINNNDSKKNVKQETRDDSTNVNAGSFMQTNDIQFYALEKS